MKTDLVKREFAHLSSLYFNSAYFGPSPYRTKQRVEQALQKDLDPSFYAYQIWTAIAERLREKIAGLLGCSPDSIFHSTSTSDVVSLVANGMDWKKGDQVCSLNREYPSNVLPWMVAQNHYPFEFCLLDIEPHTVPTREWLEKNIPPHCRVLNISWVAFESGKCCDLEEVGRFCREREICFLVDATQGFGGMAITPKELSFVDVLACSTYKWMLAPYGHAFGYFSEEATRKVRHQSGNWTVSANAQDISGLLDYTDKTLPGARKFERGQPANMLLNAGLESSLDLLTEIGLDNIQEHNRELCAFFLDNFPQKKFELITPRDHMANIICLKTRHQSDSGHLEEQLEKSNICASTREGSLRLSFHLYNDREQVGRLIQVLEQL